MRTGSPTLEDLAAALIDLLEEIRAGEDMDPESWVRDCVIPAAERGLDRLAPATPEAFDRKVDR